MTTAAPILIFFTTNYMGTGYVATPSTRAVNGGVIREKAEESTGHPTAMRRPAATLVGTYTVSAGRNLHEYFGDPRGQCALSRERGEAPPRLFYGDELSGGWTRRPVVHSGRAASIRPWRQARVSSGSRRPKMRRVCGRW